MRRNEVDGSEKRRKAARERRFEISSGICILQRQRARARERQEEAWQARKAAARSDPMLGEGRSGHDTFELAPAAAYPTIPFYPCVACHRSAGQKREIDRVQKFPLTPVHRNSSWVM